MSSQKNSLEVIIRLCNNVRTPSYNIIMMFNLVHRLIGTNRWLLAALVNRSKRARGRRNDGRGGQAAGRRRTRSGLVDDNYDFLRYQWMPITGYHDCLKSEHSLRTSFRNVTRASEKNLHVLLNCCTVDQTPTFIVFERLSIWITKCF